MHKVGAGCERSGRYQCSTCSHTIAVKKGDKFPPCSACGRKDISWKLVAAR